MAMDLGSLGSGLGGALSLGGGIYSAIAGSQEASQINAQEQAIFQTQIQENAVRRSAMELENRRKQTENIRQTQYARSMALNTATNQGAQFGSGLQGAYGSISGQSSTNTQTLGQNLLLSEKMFDLSDQQSAAEMYLAKDQAAMSGIAGMNSLLGGLGKSLGNIGSLANLAIP